MISKSDSKIDKAVTLPIIISYLIVSIISFKVLVYNDLSQLITLRIRPNEMI
jgi:hypothetical protein